MYNFFAKLMLYTFFLLKEFFFRGIFSEDQLKNREKMAVPGSKSSVDPTVLRPGISTSITGNHKLYILLKIPPPLSQEHHQH